MRQVKCGQLANGFRFYAQYDSRNNNVSGIGVKCGSIHDPPGQVGMAHFAEHNLVRESLKYPEQEVNSILERYLGGLNGVDINVRTDRISTFYGHGDLLRRRHMFECFDLFASLLGDKIINKRGIGVESGAVHQEYYLYGLDFMPSLVEDLMHELVYIKNPARNRIDCQPEDLRQITPNQVRRFARRHYTPSNMFAIMLGPKFEEVRERTKRLFDHWEGPEPPVLDYDGSDNFPMLREIKSAELTRNIHQYHVAIGFPTEPAGSKDDEVLEVISRVLSARLMQRLRGKNLDFNKGVYRALAFIPRSFVHGMIYCWFATSDKDFAKFGENVILEEIKKLREELVSDRERDDMVQSLDLIYLDAFQNVAEILCELIIEAVCNGDEDLTQLHAYRDRLYRVSRRKIREVANKYFGANHARVVIGPSNL